jgi:EAL domain-containing protein (putative c-di-GMP-specific phosphodiesterase class I)
MIQRLTALGCRFALDDFGTGTNSLTNLKALQISRVKIDGSFVRDIVTDKRSQATVRGIVELAKGLSMDTVAEYVENDTIADVVRRMGVDYAQGYAFSKPEPLDALLADLAHDESRRMQKLMLEL